MKRKQCGIFVRLLLILALLLVPCAGALAQSPPSGESESAAPDSLASPPARYAAVKAFGADDVLKNESVASTAQDESAVLVAGGSVTLDHLQIDRLSSVSADGERARLYGVGAAVLATDGTAYLSNSYLTSDANGGAGVFAYGSGTVYAADTAVVTKQAASGGVHAAGGGRLYGWDLTVATSGAESAAISSDRGGGTMALNGGSYLSTGSDSPAVYSAADITVANAVLQATGSEAAVIEGRNSLKVFDSDLTGEMPDPAGNDGAWTVLLYQSASDGASIGRTTFQMTGGTLTSKNGGVFYATNTESEIRLSNTAIVTEPDCPYLLRCTGNRSALGWGAQGENGADCTLIANAQTLKGSVIWDSLSTLDMYVYNNSSFTGTFVKDDSFAGGSAQNPFAGHANLFLSENSLWTVTESCSLTGLYNEAGNAAIADAAGQIVNVVGANGTVYIKGDSDVTVTVDVYSQEVNFANVDRFDQKSDSLPAVPAPLAAVREAKPEETTATGEVDDPMAQIVAQEQNNLKKVGIVIGCVVAACVIVIIVIKRRS